MPSVGSFKAQPVTRSYVVTQDTQNSEYGAYFFNESTIDAWFNDNSDDITKVSSGLYIITGDFAGILGNLDDDGSFNVKRSLVDMGKEIIIGNPSDSRLVVLRKVKNLQNPGLTAGGNVAYIVVESNYRGFNWDTPSSSRYNVNVARA